MQFQPYMKLSTDLSLLSIPFICSHKHIGISLMREKNVITPFFFLFSFESKKGINSRIYCQNCQILLLTDSILFQLQPKPSADHNIAHFDYNPCKLQLLCPCNSDSCSLTGEWCTGECTTGNNLKLRFRFSAASCLCLKSSQVKRAGKLSLIAQKWWFLNIKSSHWPALAVQNTSNTNYSNSLLPAAGTWSEISAITHWAIIATNPLQADHRNINSFPCWLSRMARTKNSEVETQLFSNQSMAWPPFGSVILCRLFAK